jgi:hypothetical protein
VAAGSARAAGCDAGDRFLNPGRARPSAYLIDAFGRGLAEQAYVEGRNVAGTMIDCRNWRLTSSAMASF